jgi:hypothetical protein
MGSPIPSLDGYFRECGRGVGYAQRVVQQGAEMSRSTWSIIITSLVIIIGIALAICVYRTHQEDASPQLESIRVLQNLHQILTQPDDTALLSAVVVPGAYKSRTTQEQADFIRKALRDEVSSEGISVLMEEGQYGPLIAVFPEEATNWAQRFGVEIDDCVAFRAERNGLRAEVVILGSGPTGKILRCNNVKQLALP